MPFAFGIPRPARRVPRTKVLWCAGAIALAVVAAACSGAVETPIPDLPTVAPVTPSPTPVKKTYQDMVVGFIQNESQSAWRKANTASFRDTAAQLGVKLTVVDAQGEKLTQLAAFSKFVADPTVNVIVLAAVDGPGYDDVLNAARAAGKIVVIEDRPIDSDPALYYAFVGSDYQKEGQQAAAALCDLMKGSSSKNVIEIGGDQADPRALDRQKGFRQGNSCGLTMLDSQFTPGWDPSEATSIMQAFMGKYSGKINGVFGHSDELAIAAIKVITGAGQRAGRDVAVVGVDATADGFKYLISGELGADIECNPLLGPLAYKAALDGLNHVEGAPKSLAPEEGVFYASQGTDALMKILDGRKY